MPLQPQRLNIPISGGLAQDETPEYLDPPALYQCDNFYHRTKSSLTKRNGYDAVPIIVDSRNTTRDMSIPFTHTNAAAIDRFMRTESSVTFAARGYLWTYDPSLYAGATSIDPRPNTIRHGEIPDLQIKRDTVVSIDGANFDTSYISDAASANSVTGESCTSYLVVRGSATEWHLKITSAQGATLSDTIILTSSHQLMRPCVAAFSGGFIATCLNYDQSDLYAYQFLFSTMAWDNFAWPSIDWGGSRRNDDFDSYDMVGTGSNTFIVGQIIADCWFVLPGWQDAKHEHGSLIVYTIDATTGALINGPQYCGNTDWNRTPGLWPRFAVAGDNSGNYAGIWYDDEDRQIYFTSFSGSAVRPLVSLRNDYCSHVGLGFVTPTTNVDAQWNLLWEVPASTLALTVTDKRYNTYSAIHSSTQTEVGYVRAYFDTKIGSNPFCVGGGSYTILIPDTPSTAVGGLNSVGDVPWILTRTWNDQWRGDPDETTGSFQYPEGVWGYGTTYGNIQPARINLDLASSGRKAFGALVTCDVFGPSYGNAVVNLTLDPTSPDRYDSAPLPGGGAIFGCAQPWIFDGSSSFEAAFIQRPVIQDQVQSSGGALEQDVGDDDYHYFQAIYEHSDERGRVTRSAVSPTYMIKITGPNNQIRLRILNLFWTARKANSVQVKVYLSRDNITFALAGIGICTTYDGTDSPDDVYVTISQYPPATAPAIYTSDGSLESGYPQLASHLVRWNNRIWIGDDHDLSYSHAFITGDQVSFPDTFTESLDREITALTPLDDRILLFSDDAVLFRSGEGPSWNGVSSSYSNWTFLTHEVGCTNSRSVFHSLVGVFFQSRRGLELMDAGGNIVHQRAVENYFGPGDHQGSGDTVVGVLSLPRDHQARILYRERASNQLKQLVFDYSTGTWSRWYGGTVYTQWYGDSFAYVGDITVVGSTVYIVDASGWIYIEANGRQWDNVMPLSGTPQHYHINWSVQSPWIKAEGLHGVQRVWRSSINFKCQSWTNPPYPGAPTPTMGLNASVSVDYSDVTEVHPGKTIADLQVLRNATSGIGYLTIGHKYQQCRAYQLQLSSNDTNVWSWSTDVSSVTELLGFWVEFGVEPGTGRGRREGKI